MAALETAANSETDTNAVLVSVATFTLRIVNMCKTVQYYYHPYRRDHGVFSISKFAQTREWSRSLIRVIRWHPNVFKLAVAACDDSIRIYSDDRAPVVLLKVGLNVNLLTHVNWHKFLLDRTSFKSALQPWRGVH